MIEKQQQNNLRIHSGKTTLGVSVNLNFFAAVFRSYDDISESAIEKSDDGLASFLKSQHSR